MLSQPQAKILVGDPNQQIYAFRGAINAMQSIEANQVFYLTQVSSTIVFLEIDQLKIIPKYH